MGDPFEHEDLDSADTDSNLSASSLRVFTSVRVSYTTGCQWISTTERHLCSLIPRDLLVDVTTFHQLGKQNNQEVTRVSYAGKDKTLNRGKRQESLALRSFALSVPSVFNTQPLPSTTHPPSLTTVTHRACVLRHSVPLPDSQPLSSPPQLQDCDSLC